jgi:hypothetical protein
MVVPLVGDCATLARSAGESGVVADGRSEGLLDERPQRLQAAAAAGPGVGGADDGAGVAGTGTDGRRDLRVGDATAVADEHAEPPSD